MKTPLCRELIFFFRASLGWFEIENETKTEWFA